MKEIKGPYHAVDKLQLHKQQQLNEDHEDGALINLSQVE